MDKYLKKIIVALDVGSFREAKELAAVLAPTVGFLKVGSKLFTSEGPRVCELVKKYGGRCFLDLKFHDIPNTVKGAVVAAASIGVEMLTIHALGGREMIKAAVEAANESNAKPTVIAVTVLTSHGEKELKDTGIEDSPFAAALKLTELAKASGAHGIVASALEAPQIRALVGDEFLIVTPGVRPQLAALQDQKRVATPAQALKAGADYIVVGRPVYKASDPLRAVWSIAEEMRSSPHST